MRRYDWQTRLRDVLLAYDASPWRWGVSDCVCVADDIAEALTGNRPFGAAALGYRCPRSARATLHQPRRDRCLGA